MLFEKFAFTSDIPSIELRCDILAESRYILTSDYIPSYRCLDGDRELCFGDIVLELLTDLPTEIASSCTVYHHRECIDWVSGDSYIHLHDVIYFVPHRLIVETRIS